MVKQNKQQNKISISDIIGYLAIILIVVSLFFIGMKVTGYVVVTDTAVVNVTVTTSAAINFTTDFINFGTGTVNATKVGATVNTEGSVLNGTGFTVVSAPLVLQNIGNVNVSLNLSSSKSAATFIGGTNPSFKVKVTDKSGETGACITNGAVAYTELSTTNISACGVFEFIDSRDEIDVDVQLFIPYNTEGAMTTIITATGTSA